MDTAIARDAWLTSEPLHAVTYFAPESREAMRAVGLRGFWMGYFAARAAPLGRVSAAVVEASFANFHPAFVRRSIPDAWSFASPRDVLRARLSSAASALRRLAPAVDEVAERLARDLSPALRAALAAVSGAGRPLFCANRDLPDPADPVAALWQVLTTSREHRGDGHVAVLTAEGLDGCEAHALLSAAADIPGATFRDNRGFSDEDWAAARRRLAARGLLDASGAITRVGGELRHQIERRTDRLALAPYETLGEAETTRLIAALSPLRDAVIAGDGVPFPNPMGLPRPRLDSDEP